MATPEMELDAAAHATPALWESPATAKAAAAAPAPATTTATAPLLPPHATASNGSSNQETESAAMTTEEAPAAAAATSSALQSSAVQESAAAVDQTKTTTTNTEACARSRSSSPSSPSSPSGANEEQPPMTTPQQFVSPAPVLALRSGSMSARQPQKTKRRNKSSKCLGDGMHDHDSSPSLSNIKTSLSMTSLPPDEEQESRDGINAKLKVERPYNSLKKSTERSLTNQLARMHHSHHSGNGSGSSSSHRIGSSGNGSGSGTGSGSGGGGGHNKHHRYSWGSGHSSSSLHSSAATLGMGSCKDDLWAAIQTNYNYIMDTNLLDTCKEARCEIEGAASVADNITDTSLKMLDESHRNVGSYEDPKELRKWLREMEHKMENAPTLSEATTLSCAELQRHLNEHTVLYHEIVSHARVVSACIRVASEKEKQQKQQQQEQLQLQQQQQEQLQLQLQQQQHDSDASLVAEQTNSSLSSTEDNITTTTTSSGIVCCSAASKLPATSTNNFGSSAVSFAKKTESNWDRLQNRYHLLYLKAFEVQLWLDGLLRKKSSSPSNLTNEDLDSEDIDVLIDSSDDCLDGSNGHAAQVDGGATEDDLNDVASDLESDITHNSLSYNDDDNDNDNGEDEDEDEDQDDEDDNNGEDAVDHVAANKSHSQSYGQGKCSEPARQKLQHQHQPLHQPLHQHQHQQHRQRASGDINIGGNDDNDNDIDIDTADIIAVAQASCALLNIALEQQHPSQLQHQLHRHHLPHPTGPPHLPPAARDCIQAKIYREHQGDNDDDDEGEAEDEYEDEDEDSNDHNNDDLDEERIDGSAQTSQHQQQQRKSLGYSKLLVTFDRSASALHRSGSAHAHYHRSQPTLTDFEADSESSDLETLHKRMQRHQRSTASGKYLSGAGYLPPHAAKRYCRSAEPEQMPAPMAARPAAGDCEMRDRQTKASLVNAMVNDHLQQQLRLMQQQQQHQQQQQQQQQQRLTLMAITQNTLISAGSSANNTSVNASSSMSSGNSSSSVGGGGSSSSASNMMLQHKDGSEQQQTQAGGSVGIALAKKQKNIAIITPNNSHSGGKSHLQQHHHSSSNKSPTVLRKHHHHHHHHHEQQHHHAADISKFNRSNRKSKNCAIFYFKHLDTDNETSYSNSICGDEAAAAVAAAANMVDADVGDGGKLSSSAGSSSQASDLLKSADVSSDDEGWLYTSAQQQQQQQQQQVSAAIIESLNSNHISLGISASSTGSIQSATVSSSTASPPPAADDSDKENSGHQATAKIQLTGSSTATAASTPGSSGGSSAASSSSEMPTEANGGGAAMAMEAKVKAAQVIHHQQCHEMELQINNKRCNNNNNITSSSSCNNNNSYNQGNDSNGNITIDVDGGDSNIDINCLADSSHSPSSLDKFAINHNNNNSSNLSHNAATSAAATCGHSRHARNSSTCAADAANGNLEMETMQPPARAADPSHTGHAVDNLPSHRAAAGASNASAALAYGQHLHANVGKRLPPRSPAKSSISQTSTTTTASSSTISPTKQGKVSHESIKQLVLEAEHLVRDEALKTPTKHHQHHQLQHHHHQHQHHHHGHIQKHSISGSGGSGGSLVHISSTIKKREIKMPGPIKRVQEWLEHQPSTPTLLKPLPQSHDALISPLSQTASPARTDDCEASGEASETDSIPLHCSDDTSEGFTDSIATCMQTSTNSYGNSTERIGGSAEPIVVATSNQSLNVKVIKRTQQTRRKSERPWSVSCLSQLTTDAKQVAAKVTTIANVQSGLASHSISESALDSLSPGRPRTSSTAAQVKSYDSKGSLKRRKTRKKKHYNANAAAMGGAGGAGIGGGKRSDTNSEDNCLAPLPTAELSKLAPGLLAQSSDAMTPQQIQEITRALLQLQSGDPQLSTASAAAAAAGQRAATGESGEEETHLMRPNFRVGSYTTAYMTSEARLGSLAALATYMNEDEQQGGEYTTGTEDHHSSFSETAWDNYQEKYNSENYSEGFDSDAARKLLEFGDDYRNFIDSQSDCCSSQSAANNLDSLSPPRMDSLQPSESRHIITQDAIVSSVDHARRRRALELEYERRRKNLDTRRKSCQESLEYQNPKSPSVALSSSTQALTPKNPERFNFQQQHKLETASRKLEFGMSHSAQSLRRTSESDTSQRRRKADERRRSSRNLEKCIKLIPATSSSSADDSDDEKEMRNLLMQSQMRLDDTKALKIRCHLLRPEDYTEIINTCRDNIRCLESVLKGPTSSVLSTPCMAQSKDLLAAWEDLLGWSGNAAAARKMQEDMIVLKHALNRLGNKSSFELLDTEPSIQIAIEALKSEKTQLQSYRMNMLKLNASVHSWLTKQERRLQSAVVEQQLKEAAAKVGAELLEEKDELESEHNNNNNNNTNSNTTDSANAGVGHKQSTLQLTTSSSSSTSSSTGQTQSTQQLEPDSASVTSKATMITVTDSNGNQVETHSTITTTTTTSTMTAATSGSCSIGTATSTCAGDKNWDLQSLITSENEFHKHLKDEVSDMYTAWDEADLRINSQLEVLTSSLIAWRQLECGLSEFQLALGQDRGTLKGLEGALSTGQATPGELAQNVKLVAKLLSEKVNVSQEQLSAVQDYLDPNHVLHIAKFTASNGSLSDSGISDGGTTSDGGLSERERRLGVLRRLAKQLESALAPGSEAMKSIAARMESAEAELKSLQNTCRDLIVRTAASHQSKKLQQQDQGALGAKKIDANGNRSQALQLQHSNGCLKNSRLANGKMVGLATEQAGSQGAVNGYASSGTGSGNRRNKRKPRRSSDSAVAAADLSQSSALQLNATAPDGGDDPSDDPSLAYDLDSSDDENAPKRGWAWRIARVAVPMQLALFTVFCAACLMQPNCCDNINNLSMSFTPQLRYIRGPPPI